MNPLIQLKKAVLAFIIALTCFGLSPMAQALLPPPPPDGGYPNRNTAEGDSALFNLTFGEENTAIGFSALFSNTGGDFNTATGASALFANRDGSANTATGARALQNNVSGRANTATGATALFSNTFGIFNTATGEGALIFNTTGGFNTATGSEALFSNTTGRNNTATGTSALLRNTTGNFNTANGVQALLTNDDGRQNTATGAIALSSNTIGNFNVAEGAFALSRNTTGNNNIAVGYQAGFNVTGSNNIDIGARGAAVDTNTIRIGTPLQNRTFIAGIRGVTTGMANAIPVLIDSAAQLGTMSSSRRFKKEIKPMDRASEVILALKPVTFHYRSDKTGTPQFGLVAEEVAEVNPDLVVHDENGEIYTVRYDAVNAMLLNEFLKEHRKNEEHEKTIVELKSGMTALAAAVKEQAAQIQKVRAQLEVSKPAPQTVLNNQ
jgi:hypothetical protein